MNDDNVVSWQAQLEDACIGTRMNYIHRIAISHLVFRGLRDEGSIEVSSAEELAVENPTGPQEIIFPHMVLGHRVLLALCRDDDPILNGFGIAVLNERREAFSYSYVLPPPALEKSNGPAQAFLPHQKP